MGFERFWEIQFHTTDVDPGHQKGSGLRSLVYRDPVSGVKFANNEPWRPNFRNSQINIFNEELRGPGVQHLAIAVKDIIGCVRLLRERGLEFMPTPGTYYDALPARLQRLGIGSIDEDIAVLRDLEILVDGDGPGKYLLQIFLKESSGMYHEPGRGPLLLRDHPAEGRRGLRGRQLPGALRVDRARPAGPAVTLSFRATSIWTGPEESAVSAPAPRRTPRRPARDGAPRGDKFIAAGHSRFPLLVISLSFRGTSIGRVPRNPQSPHRRRRTPRRPARMGLLG